MTSPTERWRYPDRLLRELAILHPEEIEVEVIAEHLGATVVYEELRGCGGGLVACGDRAIITADRSAPRPEQRLAVAHELAHWLLDRGESGIVPSDPTGVWVTWWDEDGDEDEVTPEHRADEWAIELLLPELMVAEHLAWDDPMTFATIRDLCRRFDTPLLPTTQRLVWLRGEMTALVHSRRDGETELLRRSNPNFEVLLRRPPGPGTVAYELLHGQRQESPSAVSVGSDAWLTIEGAWWCPVWEGSVIVADGEVLSFLWWPGDAMDAILGTWPEPVLPLEPGKEFLTLLAKSMGRDWGYYPVAWAGNELVMETLEPSVQRVVIPGTVPDAAGIRGLVAEVARQKETTPDVVLVVMMD